MLQLVQSQARRGVVAAFVAGLAVALAVATAPAVSAVAPGLEDAIVKVPSSVIGSLDNATAAQRKYAIQRTATHAFADWKLPLGEVSKATKASGPFFVASAFLAGFEGTNVIMKVAGVDPNNVGLENVWDYVNPRSGMDNGYHLNGDMVDYVEGNGWAGYRRPSLVVEWSGRSGGEPVNGSARYDFDVEYNTETRTMVRTVVATGTPGPDVANLQWGYDLGVLGLGYVMPVSGGAETSIDAYQGPRPNGATFTYVVPSNRILRTYEYAFNTSLVSPKPERPSGYPDSFVWYAPGHPDRPADTDGNPPRNWRSTWTCSTGSGGSASSAQFFESDADWPDFPTAQCAAGTLTGMKVYQQTAGGVPADVLVYDWTPNDAPFEWARNNPECLDGTCSLLLYRIDTNTEKRVSCFDNPALCVNWLVDPQRADNYECQYGGKVVPLSECQVYGPTFNVATNTDLKTGTGPDVKIENVDVLGDPKNGDPVIQTTPNPNPNPNPQPPRDNSCPPPFTWTSLINPWWYYKGMSCALQDAFVPTQTKTQTAVTRMQGAWSRTTVAVWADAVGGTFSGPSYDSMACAGPHLVWDFQGKRVLDMYPFSACDDPQRTWATWSRLVLGTAIVFTGGFACVRALGAGFGWKPSAGGDS